MNTGVILGLGLLTIIVIFYVTLNIPYWLLLWNKRKNKNLLEDKKYHQWTYTSDDSMNKILKFCIYCLYGYGTYIFMAEMWSKHT